MGAPILQVKSDEKRAAAMHHVLCHDQCQVRYAESDFAASIRCRYSNRVSIEQSRKTAPSSADEPRLTKRKELEGVKLETKEAVLETMAQEEEVISGGPAPAE